MEKLKLGTRSLLALLLVCVSFFFVLSCFDYMLMTNFSFWNHPELMYRYWIVLGLVVVVFGFGLAFMGYLAGLQLRVCTALLSTVVLLFAGGLLDQFWAVLAYLQGTSYSFDTWSAQYKWFGFWNWPLQVIWASVFYGLVVAIWYWVLRK